MFGALKVLSARADLSIRVQSPADSVMIIEAVEKAGAQADADRQSMLKLSQQCIDASKQIRFRRGEALGYAMMGEVYRRMSSYDKAFSSYLAALKISEELGLRKNAAALCNDIATIHIHLGEYEKGLDYGLRASAELLMAKTAEPETMIDVDNLIGAAYLGLGKYDTALVYFDKANKMAFAVSDLEGQAVAMDNMAKVYRRLGDFDQARSYILEAIRLHRKGHNNPALAYTCGSAAMIYLDMGDHKTAYEYLVSAEQLATLVQDIELFIDVRNNFLSYYKAVNDYKKAFITLQQLQVYKDTITDRLTNEKMRELEALYRMEVREKEFNKLRKENTLNEINLLNVKLQQRTMVVVVFFLLLMASTIVYSLYKQNKINSRLVELNEEKNNIMAILSHDLKAPLTKLHTYVQLSGAKTHSQEQEMYLRRMKEVIHEGSEMIQNLLDVTYIEERTPNINITEIDLYDTFLMLIDEHKPGAERKQMEITFVSSLSELVFMTDYQKFRRIIDNVLSNAVKYNNIGKPIQVSVSDYKSGILVKIKDEGQGMDKEDVNKLFTKFSRLKSTPTGGEASTGMGLYIVSNLCELLNGKVWCESSPGAGSTFYIYLPSFIGQ